MKSIMKQRGINPNEHLLYYRGGPLDALYRGEITSINVTPNADGSPVMNVRNCRDGYTNVQELLVADMVVGQVTWDMFPNGELPTTLQYGYVPDELELMYPHEMKVFGPKLETWTWDAVAKLYPAYAGVHRPKNRQRPHVSVGTVGHVDRPMTKPDMTVTYTVGPGDPFYISDAERRFYDEWAKILLAPH